MNLLDSASIVVTPNGYKASKLYSIVPTDGTGDMTFARTGDTATRVNSSGLIETVLANKPRLDYLGSTCPKLLLEPQATNLVTYSDAFDNAAWSTKTNITITANNATSPDGTSNADTVVTTSANGTLSRAIGITSNSTSWTQSVFVKWNSGYELVRFRLAFYGGSGITKELVVNIKTGAFVSSDGTYKIETYPNGWFRISITATNDSTNNTIIYQIFNTNSLTQTVSASYFGAQLENLSYATSYIPTTTASVTRNADNCSKSSISSLIGQTEGTIFWDSVYLTTDSQLSITAPNNGMQLLFTNNVIYIYLEVSGSLILYTSMGGNVSLNNRYKLAIAYGTNYIKTYLNGVLIYSNTSTLSMPATSKLSLGNYDGVDSSVLKKINSVALWKTKLTDQELVTLTTI